MPGKSITHTQVKLYMSYHKNPKQTQISAAAKAGFSERSARRIDKGEHQSNHLPRNYRTHKDPFNGLFEKHLVPLLEKNSALQPITLLDVLEEKVPGQFDRSHLHTLQRRVKRWRAKHALDQEVIFLQRHTPGDMGISDYTWMNTLGITLAGAVFEYKLYHYRLVYSGWTYVQVCLGGESFKSLSSGLQNAFWRSGGVPVIHRTNSLSAALFALQNPLNKGVILADEVGLGKTIEAALVMSQLWAERKRRIVVVCPAALRKQWSNELAEKFNLPTQVIDGRTYKKLQKEGIYNPLDKEVIRILSYNFVSANEKVFSTIPWDLVVIDEAHKLRNAYRESHQTGQAIKNAFCGCKKLLLTATPLQNNLMEVYGLSTIIDEHLFGEAVSFRVQFMRDGYDLSALKKRMKEFTQRTLRSQVLEYVKYTKRMPITVPFKPFDDVRSVFCFSSKR